MKVLGIALVSLLLHLTLGWAWTLFAGMAGGVWAVRQGWLLGAAGVGLAWAVLIAYNFLTAAAPVAAMTRTFGAILGNLPGPVIVGFTLLIGLVLGALGGLVGSQTLRLLRRPQA